MENIENIINEYVLKNDYKGMVSKFTRNKNKELLNKLKDNMVSLKYEIDTFKETSQLLYHYT